MRGFLPVLVLCVVVISCGGTAPEPSGVPAPQEVPFGDVPQSFDQTFYFMYGWDEQEGPEGILDMLLSQEVEIRRAWVPDSDQPGPCLMLQLTQLIIEVRRPDPRLLDLGFTQDAGSVHLGVCNPIWLEYRFGRLNDRGHR